MSLGGSSPSTTMKNALAYAHQQGVTIVCASGNNASATQVSYPAAYDEYCIAVGATRYDKSVVWYSNGGASLDIVAPGGDTSIDQNGDEYGDGILQQTFGSSTNDWGYYFKQGTSMASPHVAGVAALIISSGTAYSPQEIRGILESTATDMGASGWDARYGWGILDAAAALNYNAPDNNAPVADAAGPYSGSEDVPIAFDGSASFDDDGDTLTYRWDFGDGSTEAAAGASPTHQYISGGTYTVTLIVNDSKTDSLPATTTVTVTEIPDPPVADAGPDQDTWVGNSLTFDAVNSYDTDKGDSIVTYEWDFGDGSTDTGQVVNHTYDTPGTYNVILTVTDTSDLNDTDAAVVTVTEQPPLDSTMHVENIEKAIVARGANVSATATPFVTDTAGNPVEGAAVTGHWSTLTFNDNEYGTTNGNGEVTFKSNKVKTRTGTFVFHIDSVTKDGWTYDEQNSQTSNSIDVP